MDKCKFHAWTEAIWVAWGPSEFRFKELDSDVNLFLLGI
jgi:hypothetical protein